jgi:hypothetical protein
MDLTERLAAAKARLAAAKAALTEKDREDLTRREELAKLEAEAESEELSRRQLDLARRLDAARDKLGPNAALKTVAVKGYNDTFIVQRNGKAHAAWTEAMSRAQSQEALQPNKKIDRGAINRNYAVAVVYDWNGCTDFDALGSTSGNDLIRFLTDNPGIVTPLTDAAVELVGALADERKS